jgi:hypothetical protein
MYTITSEYARDSALLATENMEGLKDAEVAWLR